MKSRSMVLELSVQCIARPAPAEKPIMPKRAVSTPHSAARLIIMAYAASASASWLDKSIRGGVGRGASFEASEAGGGGVNVRFIDSLNASRDSGVGLSRYLSTKAAMPLSAKACATSQPSLPIDSHRKPPPGA